MYHDQMGITPRVQGWFHTWNLVNSIQHINRIKEKCYMIISLDVEKSFNNIWHPLMLKTLKLWVLGSFLKMIKGIYEIPAINIMISAERLKAFHLILDMTWCLLSHHFCIEVLARAVMQEKGNKKHPNKKGNSKIMSICCWYNLSHKKS